MEHDGLAALELRTMRSAWRALDRRWELTSRERRDLFPAGGEYEAEPPRDTETRMRILIELGYRIGLGGDLLQEWLRKPTQTLGWLTPLDVMGGSLGDLRGLRNLVERGFAS